MAELLKTAFPPVVADGARLLILGSMPGEASLRLGQYYGHARNAFWPIIGALLGCPPDADYAARTAALTANRIALWDVIATCARRGSLDSAIEPDSVRVNDFDALFGAYPGIRCIAFNGGTAEREYQRRVFPALPVLYRHIERIRLPSTSPAHAGMALDAKLAAWRVLLDRL